MIDIKYVMLKWSIHCGFSLCGIRQVGLEPYVTCTYTWGSYYKLTAELNQCAAVTSLHSGLKGHMYEIVCESQKMVSIWVPRVVCPWLYRRQLLSTTKTMKTLNCLLGKLILKLFKFFFWFDANWSLASFIYNFDQY